MSVVVIGVGNPVLSDDRVGLQVVDRLEELLKDREDVAIRRCYAGGISLMEAMTGHKKAIIVDAIITKSGTPGTVRTLDISDLAQGRTAHSTHDASLAVALELGRVAGLPLPEDVKIYAIEVKDVATPGEALTEPVERAVPDVVQAILGELKAGLA